MTGVVTSREALVWIKVCSRDGRKQDFEAVVDTGFSGFLTLPAAIIDYFGFLWKNQVRGELADGSEFSFEVFEGAVIWNRRLRHIPIEMSNSRPLIGMSLLKDCELNIRVRENGKVKIKPLPPTRSRR